MKWLTTLTAGLAGLLFGLGLIVSGMADPAKVRGFLDLAGAWNPSLAFVMGGAILAAFLPFRFLASRRASLLGEPLRLPARRDITRPLVVGSLLFGAGWALAGVCPGPALVRLGSGSADALVFTLSMLAGMKLFSLYDARCR
ncbi:DUF6691 family protein [Paludibacterium paludis]|uniref:Membrane protein n=1 Tax=Paludibacterium paludis TaxID=1225769 RepID=A0A918U9H6_9NEIS|nr:DUF6691 family protein [Paludibacterium paludis]GGY15870.1 membrane protein [Paludibacterium paludis]